MKFAEFQSSPRRIARDPMTPRFTDCTPVQEMTLDKTLKGIDVYVPVSDGHRENGGLSHHHFSSFSYQRPLQERKALIIVPTREGTGGCRSKKRPKLLGKALPLQGRQLFSEASATTKQEKLLRTVLTSKWARRAGSSTSYKSGKLDLKAFDILVIDEATAACSSWASSPTSGTWQEDAALRTEALPCSTRPRSASGSSSSHGIHETRPKSKFSPRERDGRNHFRRRLYQYISREEKISAFSWGSCAKRSREERAHLHQHQKMAEISSRRLGGKRLSQRVHMRRTSQKIGVREIRERGLRE